MDTASIIKAAMEDFKLSEEQQDSFSKIIAHILSKIAGEDEGKASEVRTEIVLCPSTKQEVTLFRNICQDWPDIPTCLHGVCGFYPVIDRTPVVNVALSPAIPDEKTKVKHKESAVAVTADAFDSLTDVPGIIDIDGEEIKITGNTFGERIRSFRNALLRKYEAVRVKEIVNLIVNRRSASAQTKSASIAGVIFDPSKNYFVWTTLRVVAKTSAFKCGFVENVYQYPDDSLLIKFACGNNSELVTADEVIKLTRVCSRFSHKDSICKNGCVEDGIIAGKNCPHSEVIDHESCKCFDK
jgi:hypothetical protein